MRTCTGDIGYFDEDGFLVLVDRKKDMIISGGFNIYPSDLEAVLRKHPDVAEAAVIGVPSVQWGKTPVAFVAMKALRTASPASLKNWANLMLGKTQRLSEVHILSELPRSAVGKVLKRELRDRYLHSESRQQQASRPGGGCQRGPRSGSTRYPAKTLAKFAVLGPATCQNSCTIVRNVLCSVRAFR